VLEPAVTPEPPAAPEPATVPEPAPEPPAVPEPATVLEAAAPSGSSAAREPPGPAAAAPGAAAAPPEPVPSPAATGNAPASAATAATSAQSQLREEEPSAAAELGTTEAELKEPVEASANVVGAAGSLPASEAEKATATIDASATSASPPTKTASTAAAFVERKRAAPLRDVTVGYEFSTPWGRGEVESFREISGERYAKVRLVLGGFVGVPRETARTWFLESSSTTPTMSQSLEESRELALVTPSNPDFRGQHDDDMRLFVGGLPGDADSDHLHRHFRKYGELSEATVIRDRATGRSRHFGFVALSRPSQAIRSAVLRDSHEIARKKVTVRLHDNNEDDVLGAEAPPSPTRGGSSADNLRKVFIGGLEPHLTSEALRDAFICFGRVVDIFVARDSNGIPKRFGFVTFESSSAAKKALDKASLRVADVSVQIKSATPMRSSADEPRSRSGSSSGGGPLPSAGGTVGAYGYGAAPPSAYGYGGYGAPQTYPPPSGYVGYAPVYGQPQVAHGSGYGPYGGAYAAPVGYAPLGYYSPPAYGGAYAGYAGYGLPAYGAPPAYAYPPTGAEAAYGAYPPRPQY